MTFKTRLTEPDKEAIAARYGMTAQELREKQYRAAFHQSGHTYPIACKVCGNKFDYNPKGNWKHTCSAKCRKALSRQQKKALDNQ